MRRLTGLGLNPSGLCECGCGGVTPISKRGNTAKGHVMGQHVRFILGHQSALARSKRKHDSLGISHTPEWIAAWGARDRCTNPKNPQWKRYGGRGIEFRFETLQDLMVHIGPRPSAEHSIDRIKNNKHYEAGNIRWATRREQQRNTRHTKLTLQKARQIRRLRLTLSGAEVAKRFQVSQSLISEVTNGRKWTA